MGDDVTPAQNQAEWSNICARATAQVDEYINQVLRATVDQELHHGPDFRVTTGPGAGGMSLSPYWGYSSANARIILSRTPVLSVTSVQTCPNNLWPRVWTSVPTGMFEPEVPPIGIYGSSAPAASGYGGQAILIAPGYITWCYGRNGWAIQVTYVNGYPHCGITTAVAAGSSTVQVDDTTGWALSNYSGTATGATGTVKDSGQQEVVHVASASTTSGPGTLTLSAPLQFPHAPGTIITTMPASVEKACIWFAVAEALTRGATTTTIHDIGGHAQHTGGDIDGAITNGELLLNAYRRVI